MAQPTPSSVQAVDPILTNMLVGFKNADDRFVVGKLFPAVPVDKDSGTYYELQQAYWFGDEMKVRPAGGHFARGGYGVTTGTYITLGWGLEHPIPDESKANSQLPLALESVGLQWLSNQSLIRKERAWAADFMKASVWTTQDNNSATDWDDFSAGDPANDIKTGKRGISQLTGMTPNVFMCGEIVADALEIHPDMIDRIKYSQAATAANLEGAIASILGVARYLVAKAIYTATNEGQSSKTYTPVIDDDALLCYVAPNPGLFTASAGFTFTWAGGGGDGSVKTYREEQTNSDILQLKEQWDQKVISAALGAIWLDIV